MADVLAEAVARLEAAVERLAVAAARPRAAPDARAGEVAELSRRLDAALHRLRIALREEPDMTPDMAPDMTDDEDAPGGAREG